MCIQQLVIKVMIRTDKGSFYKEPERVLDYFPQYHVKRLLRDFNEGIFILTIRVNVKLVIIMGLG
jgi:hypothetical protein